MADLFVSYESEDRESARRIAQGLEAEGFSVWWDRDLRAGSDFATEIEGQLAEARLVIVLWSSASRGSKWVRDEAAYARDNNKLIPLQLDAEELPLGFRQVHALEFHHWRGDLSADPFVRLLRSVREALADVPGTTSYDRTTTTTPTFRRSWLVAVSMVVLAAIAVGLWFVAGSRHDDVAQQVESGQVTVRAFDTLSEGQSSEALANGFTDAMERVLTTNFIKTVRRPMQTGATLRDRSELSIEGTVNVEAEKLSVNVDIVHRTNDRVLWSTAMEGGVARARMLRERLAMHVADVIRCSLRLRSRANDDHSSDLFSAFLGYCEAEQGNWNRMPDLSRRIVELAPKYAISHATHALSLSFRAARQAFRLPPDEIERLRDVAEESANKAAEMDPTLGEIYWVRSRDPRHGWADEERLLLRALEADPDFIYSRTGLARIMNIVGRTRDELAYLERLVNDYPLKVAWRAQIASVEAQLGLMTRARNLFDEMSTLFPDDPGLLGNRFTVELYLGDPAIAAELLPRMGVEPYGIRCLKFVIEARASGTTPDLETLKSSCAFDDPLHENERFRQGYFSAYFGHVDAAYEVFEGFPPPPSFHLYMPPLRAFRADPRFMTLAARLGLAKYWLETDKWPDFCTVENLPYDCREAALAAVNS